jgi:ATP-dependent RNA helicase DDX49/DBP8
LVRKGTQKQNASTFPALGLLVQFAYHIFRAVWKGYREIKDAAGWTALVFAGFGIYRFCKYRAGFDDLAISRLPSLGPRFEVAADTLHPQWRELLRFAGAAVNRKYNDHPHGWVVQKRGGDPASLASTYHQRDHDFPFEHIREKMINESDRFEAGESGIDPHL